MVMDAMDMDMDTEIDMVETKNGEMIGVVDYENFFD